MFVLNEKPLPLDIPFTIGDGDAAIQYPANFLRLATAEEKASLGITEQPDPESYDDRFWWGVGNPKQLEDITVTTEEGEPYTQKGLKSQWVAQIKDTANKLLAPTDWMVLRQLSKGVGMSHIVEDYRDAVIAECNRLETSINACGTVDELAAVQSNWPETN